MQVRFWGTRGSIATPGPGTLRYGGNTACLEVRSVAGALIVIDCGTGACGLGRSLLATAAGQAVRGHILIGHTHWDHIQGLPFFAPLFVPGGEWDIYGPRGLAQILARHPGRPDAVHLLPSDPGAAWRPHPLPRSGRGCVRGGRCADPYRIPQPPGSHLGLPARGRRACLVYASDHEPYARRLACGDGQFDGRDGRHAAFLAGADLVVHDAQYTAAEYPTKMGWGHSTGEYAAAASYAAGARRLALIHHDPLRDDASLDQVLAALRAWVAGRSWPLEVMCGGRR